MIPYETTVQTPEPFDAWFDRFKGIASHRSEPEGYSKQFHDIETWMRKHARMFARAKAKQQRKQTRSTVFDLGIESSGMIQPLITQLPKESTWK